MDINLKLSPEQSRALEKAAAEDGISIEEAALRAIELYSSRKKALCWRASKRLKLKTLSFLKG